MDHQQDVPLCHSPVGFVHQLQFEEVVTTANGAETRHPIPEG